jgi:hypothetical protein
MTNLRFSFFLPFEETQLKEADVYDRDVGRTMQPMIYKQRF